MAFDLVLKPSCDVCHSTSDLYGSTCKHSTLCVSCGKIMAENRDKCDSCGVVISKLIREYNVRADTSTKKAFYIGRFSTGLPPFSKKKNANNKWTLHKEGLQGCQLTDDLREKYKNFPWILDGETGQHQYRSQQLEGAQVATYYLLALRRKEFLAVPAGSWYNFHKMAQSKQFTLEEAEQNMKKRRRIASRYESRTMKAATDVPAAFGQQKEDEGFSNDWADASFSNKGKSNDDGSYSDKVEEDMVQAEARKHRFALNKKDVVDDDDESTNGSDFDLDDENDIEKGDDWEYEETFTDDDEAVGNHSNEREGLGSEVHAAPEIKQDNMDESDNEEKLNESGKELKKLLRQAAGLDESDAADDEDHGDDSRLASVKDELFVSSKELTSTSSGTTLSPSAAPITVDEIKNVLLSATQLTTRDLIARFKERIKTKEDKSVFTEMLKGISRIRRTGSGSYVVLKRDE